MTAILLPIFNNGLFVNSLRVHQMEFIHSIKDRDCDFHSFCQTMTQAEPHSLHLSKENNPWKYLNNKISLSTIRELQLSKGGLNIHPGSCVLFHDRVHSGHYPGHLVVYNILAGVERCARPIYDRYETTSRRACVHILKFCQRLDIHIRTG